MPSGTPNGTSLEFFEQVDLADEEEYEEPVHKQQHTLTAVGKQPGFEDQERHRRQLVTKTPIFDIR